MCSILIRWLPPIWVCLVLTSVTVVAEKKSPVFRIADSLMLRLLPPVDEPRPAPTLDAIVMTVEPTLFNTQFGGTTPIDRKTFARFVDDIDTSFPEQRVVVFDFDFGPAGSRSGIHAMPSCQGNAAASIPDALDRALVCLARKMPDERLDCRGAGKTSGAGPRRPARSVILGLPDADGDQEAQILRNDWRDAMKGCGIEFASGNLLVDPTFGSVTRYHSTMDSLSHAAFCKVHPECCATRDAPGEPACHEPSADKDEMFINVPASQAGIGLCPLTRNTGVDACATDKGGKTTSATVLFVGGNYLRSDRFPTGFGRLESGVALHAESFVSMLHPLRKSELAGAAFDLCIGLVYFGFLLPFEDIRRSALKKNRELVAWLAIPCEFLVLACLLWLAFAVVFPVALSIHLWLNPIVVLVGLYLHGLIERSEQAPSGNAESAHHGPGVSEGVWTSLVILLAGAFFFALNAAPELQDDLLRSAFEIGRFALIPLAGYGLLRSYLAKTGGAAQRTPTHLPKGKTLRSCVRLLYAGLRSRGLVALSSIPVVAAIYFLFAHE